MSINTYECLNICYWCFLSSSSFPPPLTAMSCHVIVSLIIPINSPLVINCFGVPLSLLGRCHGEREGGERRGGIEDRLVDCIPENCL